jgi:hypothetical protein
VAYGLAVAEMTEQIIPIDMPTDPEEIKKAMDVRRQAVRIMLAELTMLSERLRKVIGPGDWLQYTASQTEESGSDIFGVARERQA